MTSGKPLSAARLELVPMRAAHADLLARSEREAGWAPDYPQPTDLDAARHLFESGMLYSDDGDRFGVWLVVERAAHSVIGTIGFDGPPQDRVLQISYGIVPSRRGYGLALEAVHRLTAYAHDRPEVDFIEAYAQSEASASVLRKAGYSGVGTTAGSADARLFVWGSDRQPASTRGGRVYPVPAAN